MDQTPDIEKRRKHATLGVIFLTIFVSMIGFGIVIPVLPVYAKNEPFMLSGTALGWLTGIFSLVQFFMAPILGKVSDRVGRKPVLIVSIIGTAVGYFVTGAAGSAWMLFLGRIIDGASGGNIAAAQACVQRAARNRAARRARARAARLDACSGGCPEAAHERVTCR